MDDSSQTSYPAGSDSTVGTTSSAATSVSTDTSATMNSTAHSSTDSLATESNTTDEPSWIFDGEQWSVSGSPPACPDPFTLPLPVEFERVTSILYPGQVRGGNYKPHGGFRCDEADTNAVEVTAPLSGRIVRASRYIEAGQLQILIDIIHPCGVMMRFDHLQNLAPDLAELLDRLPPAMPDQSATTPLDPAPSVAQGQVLATAVGFDDPRNVAFDFGVYDLRKRNQASQDPQWAQQHTPEMAWHGICWLDYLGTKSAAVRALPAGDGMAGKTSDYCE